MYVHTYIFVLCTYTNAYCKHVVLLVQRLKFQLPTTVIRSYSLELVSLALCVLRCVPLFRCLSQSVPREMSLT